MKLEELLNLDDAGMIRQVSGFTAMGADHGFQAQKAIDIKNTKRITEAFENHGDILNALSSRVNTLNQILEKYSSTTTKLSISMITVSILIALATIVQAISLFMNR